MRFTEVLCVLIAVSQFIKNAQLQIKEFKYLLRLRISAQELVPHDLPNG